MNKRRAQRKTPARRDGRLTLNDLAHEVARRGALGSLGPAGERSQVQAVRQKVKRDVEAGKLIQQKDGTFLLADFGTWLRRAWWRGQGRPRVYPDLPGRALDPLEKLVDKKGKLNVRVTVSVAPRVPRLPPTVPECHEEIRALNHELDEAWQLRNFLLNKLREFEANQARRERHRVAEMKRRGKR